MRKISRISTQKGNRNYYNVFLHNGTEEEFGFSVDEDLLVRYHLHKGLELNEADINEIVEQNSVQKGYQQALHYLSYRARTEQEVKQYLRDKDFFGENIEQVMQKLHQAKLLDDGEYAKRFVQSRIRSSSKGPFIIERELANKGIAEHLIEKALFDYSKEDQFAKAKEIVTKRLRRKSNHSYRRQLDQARAALQRNGFDHSVMEEVISLFQDGQDEQAEWKALTYQGEKLLIRHTKKYADDVYELEQRVKQGLYQRGFSIALIHEFLNERTANNNNLGKDDK